MKLAILESNTSILLKAKAKNCESFLMMPPNIQQRKSTLNLLTKHIYREQMRSARTEFVQLFEIIKKQT